MPLESVCTLLEIIKKEAKLCETRYLIKGQD